MLEIKNLSKIYKSTAKNGVDTKALDNVSLTFPETGMVFLLGKSGSGKSTLLNVCGGLDAPTSGEIIVKGKSSKSFSQSDFDSYRNTFIGFIFQEYNILNEFSVEDNIALALELQGKPKDKKAIAELLDEVDLSGFAKRKPNTLSGGQKQRIAIARALVKSPEIIMADEPTGALDSNTGKQVLDTLKKLSRNKLVIVVSHDRDFAELYGDRIIELKDGKILSDISKAEMPQKEISDSISTLGEVLCVKSGTNLTDGDMKQIKSFLESASGDVIIAKNEKDISTFKKAARITDSGSQEYFADTDEKKLNIKQYKPEDSKFIRSRLPLRHASKIGVSGLKNKPVRLLMTVALCTVAFILFGLLSTLTFYDIEAMFKQTLSNLNKEYVTLDKSFQTTVKDYSHGILEYEYTSTRPALFSDAEMAELRKEFGADIFGATSTSGLEFSVRSRPSDYWNNSISVIAYVPEGNSFRGKINGKYPSADNEICISSYSADMLIACKTTDERGEVLELQTYDDIIGKTLILSGTAYKVSGIFTSEPIDPKFDVLKETGTANYSLLSSFDAELRSGTYTMALLSKPAFEDLSMRSNGFFDSNQSTPAFVELAFSNAPENDKNDTNVNDYPSSEYQSISSLPSSHIKYFGASAALADNEAIISSQDWLRQISNKMQLSNSIDEESSKLLDDIYAVTEGRRAVYDEKTGAFIKEEELSKQERSELFEKLFAKLKGESIYLELTPSDENNLRIGEPTRYNVAGIYEEYDYKNTVYLSQKEFDKHWEIQFPTFSYCSVETTSYKKDPNATYSMIFAPFTNTDAQKNALWEIYSNTEFDTNSTKLSVAGNYVYTLSTVDAFVKELSNIFLYVGLVFALFAILLFSNFITTSIHQKRREIGILRAVGARGTDVFKIFFSESFVIAFICSLISIIGSIFICNALNVGMAGEFGVALFVFGPLSLLVIIGVALLTAILATIIPVWIAAKKKPVDSIKAL